MKLPDWLEQLWIHLNVWAPVYGWVSALIVLALLAECSVADMGAR